jgi:hypothetical protein
MVVVGATCPGDKVGWEWGAAAARAAASTVCISAKAFNWWGPHGWNTYGLTRVRNSERFEYARQAVSQESAR